MTITTHALTSETEEIMGLLLGDVRVSLSTSSQPCKHLRSFWVVNDSSTSTAISTPGACLQQTITAAVLSPACCQRVKATKGNRCTSDQSRPIEIRVSHLQACIIPYGMLSAAWQFSSARESRFQQHDALVSAPICSFIASSQLSLSACLPAATQCLKHC